MWFFAFKPHLSSQSAMNLRDSNKQGQWWLNTWLNSQKYFFSCQKVKKLGKRIGNVFFKDALHSEIPFPSFTNPDNQYARRVCNLSHQLLKGAGLRSKTTVHRVSLGVEQSHTVAHCSNAKHNSTYCARARVWSDSKNFMETNSQRSDQDSSLPRPLFRARAFQCGWLWGRRPRKMLKQQHIKARLKFAGEH